MITPTASQNEVIKCTYESGTTVKVVAGPGSGKTLTLMLKVRELVSKGIVRADEILILSLTNKAVDNVMHKLWDIFSELDSKQDEESQKATADLISQIGVYTIHGLANRVVAVSYTHLDVYKRQALRRTMEIFSNTTRFAFACNQSNKIIEPLQSRCAILRYSKLQDDQVLRRLLEVIQAENVQYTNDGLEAIIFTAEGDMRQALNNLQSTVAGYGLVNGENVFKIVDSPHPLVVKRMLLAPSLDDSLPVSYTHLDVYKRQVPDSIIHLG